ncbi:MAG: hypothetical protein QOE13_1910, partial [Gaiellaceae bacterium]|nr:hypothetical protein [Gaiellaceae bacterium]
PVIAEMPGELEPLDVNQRRIVVRRAGSLAVLDASGADVLSLATYPMAAQLAGNDLVVLVANQLRNYDARTGALLRTWELPPVTFGSDCPAWFDPACLAGLLSGGYCLWSTPRLSCAEPALRLEDAARGLVTYVLGGQIHLLRLGDMSDAVIDFGRVSRFTNAGLIYADGSRLHFVPFGKLPLR